jgi:CRISPR-associated protein Cas2
MLSVICCYDIADDSRRARVSDLLQAHGPRVQYSVFEIRVPSRAQLESLLRQLAGLADPIEDQIRLYLLGARPASPRIIGARTLEEWRDFIIV